MSFGTIYRVTCLVTNKSYIGQTIQNLDHYIKHHHFYYALKGEGKTRPFYKAIRKYGPSNFTWITLTECESQAKLNQQETNFIKLFDTIKNGYNVLESQAPSFMGRYHSVENKQKFSINKKKLWSNEDWKTLQLEKIKSRGRRKSAATMIIVSPTGEQFQIQRGFERFCKEHNLPFTTMRAWVNRGKIIFKRHIRQEITKNAEGWEVKSEARYYS